MDIQGADQLARLAKALKEAGDKDLQRELSQAINRAMRPLKAAVPQSAQDRLPRRGGLAAEVARAKLSTRRNKNGLRLVAKSRYSLYHLNKGEVRHPVKGGTPTVQRIEPGWWTKPTEGAAPGVRAEVSRAMDAIAAKIERAL